MGWKMPPDAIQLQYPLWLVISVVVVALAIGAAMIVAIVGKYAISQWFHPLGGPTLSTLGVALIGLSVYGNVSLKLDDFEANLSRLQKRTQTLESSLSERNRQFTTLQKIFSDTRNSISELKAAATAIPPSAGVTPHLKIAIDKLTILENDPAARKLLAVRPTMPPD